MSTTRTSLGRAPARYDSHTLRPRRGDLVRLAAYLAASALLGYWQASQPPGSMALQNSLVTSAAPLLSALSVVGQSLNDAAAVLPRAGELAAENRQLRIELAEMRRRTAALEDAALEAERLRGLMDVRAKMPEPCIAAGVIGRQLSRGPTAIIINKGRADGVRPRQPVVGHAGLVGRIYSASAHTAVAIPLTDHNSSAGAMIQRSRDAGILTGDGDTCRLNYLPLDADVHPGDVVVSSGLGGIFPKGVLIGTVISVTGDDTASMKTARVEPTVDLTRLEEVLVLRK
ncbi:MAG: rod shape-determining protein MreC [Armatimonadota bacterium]|nr:MAG: rod shape-determining protein MreC [Armatimonadota bacterium]